MIKTEKEPVFPDNWKANCPESLNEWFENLPTVKCLEEIDRIDQKYELLKLKL